MLGAVAASLIVAAGIFPGPCLSRFAQYLKRFFDDIDTDYAAHDEIGEPRAGQQHDKPGKHHADIGDHINPREYPRRPQR